MCRDRSPGPERDHCTRCRTGATTLRLMPEQDLTATQNVLDSMRTLHRTAASYHFET